MHVEVHCIMLVISCVDTCNVISPVLSDGVADAGYAAADSSCPSNVAAAAVAAVDSQSSNLANQPHSDSVGHLSYAESARAWTMVYTLCLNLH